MEGPRCGICAGPLRLHRRGRAPAAAPGTLAPTNHVPRGHGDLYRCRECGTVVQPALLSGTPLVERYRPMEDPDYLAEEDGRRRTARRLLRRLGAPAPGGRLLEVGCGHGLLLDEARRAGWAVSGIGAGATGAGPGLDPPATAAAHARAALGLDVREIDLAGADLPPESFGAVVLVDVL